VKRTIAERPADPVPMALRNAPTELMKDVGYGAGYAHAHDQEGGLGGMQCLPDALAGTRFYQPTNRGVETQWKERMEELERMRREREREGGE
jgi:putative ATPase